MIRTVFSAIVASAAMLAAAGVQAQPTTGYYVATPVKAGKSRLMTRDTPWRLENGAYVAAKASARDTMLCQMVARDVGGLSAFSVGGVAYDAAALDKCNAKAGVVATSIANN